MLRGGLPGARWIDPENYHLTLRFIGDVDDQTAREVASLLGRVRREPFELRFDALSSFGGRRPRAVIATLAQTPALMELQAEHERLMQRVGLEPEGRKYTPHVTLARLRDLSSRAGRGLSRDARADRAAAVHGLALRAVLLARLGRRRALCGGSGLSAGGVTACRTPMRPASVLNATVTYAALVAAGEIERDPAQARVARPPDRAGRAAARASAGAQIVRRSAGCSAPASASRSRSRGSTSTATSAAARPC